MNMTVNVVDAICGAGKSTALINMINEDETKQKYLYITPFLTEVERIKIACYKKYFKEPILNTDGNKLDNIKELFDRGENIVSTHALFRRFTPEITELIKKHHYILIMDEVADVIERMDITSDDLKLLASKHIKVNKDKTVSWITPNYEGKFEVYKETIQNNKVVASVNEKGYIYSLTIFFPIEIFAAFKDVWILTYMFGCQMQKYYFDLYKINYKYWYVKDFHLTQEPQTYNELDIKQLVKICDIPKINKIGDNEYALSVNWFHKNAKTKSIKILKDNTFNFFHNIVALPLKKVLWTTFKEVKNDLKGKGYTKSFVPLNIRATNSYSDRVAIAYLANRYLNPHFQTFFKNNGIEVDNDMFALSELIQMIFRSAVRNKKEVLIYLPSSRMRNLLKKWVDS